MNCPNCHIKLVKGARFCHSCGTEIVTKVKPCPHCETKNPGNARFCHACGESMNTKQAEKEKAKASDAPETPVEKYVSVYPINFDKSIEQITEQIKTHFFQALKERVKVQSSSSKYSEYLEVFYSSNFNYFFDTRIQQLTHIVLPLKDMDSERAAIKIDQLLDDGFENLLDRFTIEHTQHLNEIQLSNAVLRYQFIKKETLDIEQVIFDYLDLEKEKSEKIYTNFMNMPVSKIRNASQHFLFPARDEPILMICDQTIFGSCREGFAFTTKALYWKAHFNKAQKAYFHELYEIKNESDWIAINGNYFHVNRALNFKVSKLLKQLKAI